MATKMKRMVCYNPGPLIEEEVDIPAAPETGILVKMAYAGVCHSDIHIREDTSQERMKIFLPMVMGHEIAGYVHSIGSKCVGKDTEECDLKVGDHVIIYAWGGCMKCRACDIFMCQQKMAPGTYSYGIVRPGGYQEYMEVHDRRLVYKIPDSLPMDFACLLGCSALTSYNAISKAKPALDLAIRCTDKATLLIVGAGGLGLWGIKWAKAMLPACVKVVVADIGLDKLEQAMKDGADAIVHWDREVSDEDLIARTKDVCDGGIDAAIDYVNMASTLTTVIGAANFGVTCVMVGLMGETFPPIPLMQMPVKGITLQGIYTGSLPQQQEVIDNIVSKKIPALPITHYKLSELNEVLEVLAQGKITGRAVIKFD